MPIKFFTDDNGNAVGKKPKNAKVSTKPIKRDFIPIAYATDTELCSWAGLGYTMVFDVESFVNYFLVGFKCVETGKYVAFETSPDASIDLNKLNWLIWQFRLIGFNSRSYDVPMVFLALRGYNADMLKYYSNKIIQEEIKPFDLEKVIGLKIPDGINHIDLIEVCPLKGSLKKYAAHIHALRIQDLPFDNDKVLTQDEAEHTKNYCLGSDIVATEQIFGQLSEQIRLRYTLSDKYDIDLRSKSDAQIAEASIKSEIYKKTGKRVKREIIGAGTQFKYVPPDYLKFQSVGMQKTLQTVKDMVFEITEEGKLSMPETLSNLEMQMGQTVYKFGKGGLHSKEKCAKYISENGMIIIDSDVESYYPRLILNSGLYPEAIGPIFLDIFKEIVDRRITAKTKAKELKDAIKQIEDKLSVKFKDLNLEVTIHQTDADSLKITINGTFGKLGSRWSIMFAPNLLIQVTMTGQLALSMFIERCELAGFQVISANTDGVVVYIEESRYAEFLAIREQWCKDTALKMEETRYKALYSRDVNNYIAIKTDNKVKLKGAYSNPWNDPEMAIFRFHKNPMTTVCIEAVSEILVSGKPVEQTIKECKDITKFVCVRDVKGGAHKDGVYLGKTVRWYYSTEETGTINYVLSGNNVPETEGARPMMDLEPMPFDLDYAAYIEKANSMLYDIGFYQKPKTLELF